MSKETSCGIFKCVVLGIMIMYAISFASIIADASTKAEARERKMIVRYINEDLRKGKCAKFKIKFIRANKLTRKMLLSRKIDKIIYVEITDGYIMSEKNYAGITTDGFYINYAGIDDSLPKGTKMRTYCVFDPENNWEDDIVCRTDRVLNTKRNNEPIRKAKKKFYANFGYTYDSIK